MRSNLQWFMRGVRLLTALALILSVVPLGTVSAAPIEQLDAWRTTEPSVGEASTGVEPTRVERSTLRADRVAAALPVSAPQNAPQAPNAVNIVATKRDAVVNDVDGDGRADPGDTLRYTVVITNSGDTDAASVVFNDTIDDNTVLSGTLKSTPLARNDAYTAVGNVRISLAAGSGVLANDSDPDGSAISVVNSSATSANGGNVAVNADGSFTYNPPPGFEGADTFTYTIQDADGNQSSATVTVTVSGMIWFINVAAAAGGDGRLTTPFNCLSGAGCFSAAADDAGDNIFVYENAAAYSGGITLLNNQKLIGQDATSSLAALAGVTPPSYSDPLPAMNTGAPASTINGGANAVALAQNNALYGFTAGTATGASIGGSGFGTLLVNDVLINTTGAGLGLSTGAFGSPATFTSITSSGGSNNVSLIGVTGTANLGSGALSGASSHAFAIDGGTAVLVYSGTINNTTARSVSVINKTGGSVTFSGAVNGTAQGVFLNSNTGATITFFGGLALNTGANAAFTATGGGTVNVCDENPCNPAATGALVNTLSTTTGTALNVANTTIGANDLEFRSISANGAITGIVLNNTGASGNLAVKGNGGSCTSAGTCSGGAIQNTTGDGLALTSTNGVVLTRLFVGSTGNQGINTSALNGLTLTSSYVTNAGNSDNEHGLNLVNVQGTVTIDGTTFNGASEDLIHLENNNVNVTLNVINSSQFSHPASIGGFANSAILLLPGGTAAITALIQNSTFTNVKNAAAQIGANLAGSTGTQNFTFSNNTINITLLGRAGGVIVSGQESTTTNITIDNNNFTGAGGNGVISIDTNDSAIVRGTASGNNISNPPGIGMFIAVDEAAKSDVTLNGNTITNSGGDGIQAVNFGGAGVSSMDMTMTNNQINGHSLNTGVSFVGGVSFTGFEDNSCVVLRSNTVINTPVNPTQCGGAPCVDYYLEEVGGTVTMEEVPNTGNTTVNAAYVNSINDPGPVTVFGIIDLTNGGTCNVTGLGMLPDGNQMLAQNQTEIDPRVRAPVVSAASNAMNIFALVQDLPVPSVGGNSKPLLSLPFNPAFAPQADRVVNLDRVEAPIAPLSIGTLPAGKTVTLTFEVVINNPMTPGVTQVSNQGTVSGGNFSSVLTDDPDTGAANDPTVTPLDIQVDLQVTKTVNPATAYPGLPITYTITYLNAGPQASTNVVITDPIPSALTGVSYQSSATLTPTGSYVWTIGTLLDGQGGTITVTGTINPVLSVPTTITNTAVITGTGRDTNSSNNTASVSLPINDQPISGLNATNDSPTLLGSATNFTATISAGTNVVYQWNFGDGSTANGASASRTYAAIGTYTATVTATNSSNSQVATTIVTVVDVPIAGLNASNDSPTRLGNATNFNATISAGSNVIYAWDFGDGATDSGATPAHTYAALGTYTATVTATNSVNQQVATTVVTVIDQPISGLTATNDSPTQLGSATNFTATLSGGTNVTYQWNFGDESLGSGANASHTYGAVGPYVATITATNGVSVVVATTNVTIVDVPITGLTAANSSPTILGDLTAFTATISGGTNVVYTWNFGDGNSGSGATAAHGYAAVGTYTATVTATNGSNIQVASTVAVIFDIPITGLSATNDSPTRVGNATHFTATTTGGSGIVYTWDFGDGNFGNGSNPSYTYGAIGTYTATVTATNSLNSQTASTVVIVIDQPITDLTASNDSPTRLGSATHFTATLSNGTNVSYQWDFGDGATGSGATTSHTYGAIGAYVATVTATNGVSVVVATTNVTIIDTPIVNLVATNDSPTQLGSATNLTATIGGGSNVTYQWNFGDGATGSGATASHTYGAVGPYVAIVTATNGVSVVVASTNVSIVDVPITGLTAANSSPTILGDSTAFTATIGSGTNVVYAWEFGDGATGSGATASHTYGAIGAYTATVTATNGSNTVVATTVATVFDTPITGLTATSDSPTRLGNGTSFTATTTGGSGITYAWAFGDGVTGSGATPVHTYVALGTYTATVTATNSLNSQTASTVVIVIDQPITDLNAVNDSPTRLGSVTNFTATISGGTNVTYQWNFGDGATSSGATAAHTYSAVGAYVATITATNGVSVVVATTNVSIIDTPIVNLVAANDSPTRLGSATNFTATIDDGSNVAYQWNFGDGLLGSGATPAHTYGAIGAYVATVTATNGVSVVVATTNVSIIDRAIVGLSATNSSPTGLGNATIFTATIGDGSNVVYQWNFGDGNTGSGANTSHTYGAIGTYTATVTATNSVSVVVASTVATVINQPITGLTAANSSPTRLGSVTAFTATIATGSTVSYAWDFGDGATGSGANASHTYAAVGTYTATVTATNTINSQTATTIVVVIDRAIVSLSASNDSPTRLGSTTSFTATISDGSNVTYQWVFGDGSTGSGATANHVYGAVGSYVATVTATNGVSVVVAATNVSIIDTPIVGLFAANSSPTGLGLATALTATIGSGSNVAYQWNFGDGSIGSDATTSHVYPALGNYTATVTATNGVSNVVATTFVTIVDQPLSNLTVTSSSPTLLGTTSFFTATANGSSLSYTWDFGDGVTGNGANPSHTYAATGWYTAIVTATNSTGTLTATTKVNVFSGKIYLPLIARNYVSAPDLVVTSLQASTGNVQVVIKNQGDAAVSAGFYVDVYINPHPAPTAVNQIWSDGRSAQGLTWGVTSSLLPGQVLTLTIGDAYYLLDYSVFTGTLPTGTPVYAQVDSLDPATTYGAVHEIHEINGLPYNNILGPVLSTATLAPLNVERSIDGGNYWLPVRLKVR
ncbi:Collagenase ColH [Thermoflexales bacterium]|nr:Collagenase ColH [Thermoflexales bacterium]